MRVMLLAFLFCTAAASAASPTAMAAARPVLEEALKTFRTEGPKGWSFTQKTTGAGHSRVERFNARKPEFERWTLVEEDGHPPTAEETKDYMEKQSRRSRGGTAPRVTDQLDLSTLELAAETDEILTFHCRLKAGEAGDDTAKFLLATLLVHPPTRRIESFELAATSAFSPTWGVKIAEMKTTLTYSRADETRPSLLQKSTTHLRGRAFLFKSLDADMEVTFSDYEFAKR